MTPPGIPYLFADFAFVVLNESLARTLYVAKIIFEKKNFLHWGRRRKLSFDTKNAEIEQKIIKSQEGHNNPPLPIRVTIFDLPIAGLS